MSEATEFAAFSGPDGRPTQAERGLIEASASGAVADCSALSDDQRKVSAALIAALTTRRFSHAGFPRWSLCPTAGFGLTGATISDTLTLAGEPFDARWFFTRCEFERGIDLSLARVRGGVLLQDCSVKGEFSIYRAHLTDGFAASNTTFDNPGGFAVNARSSQMKEFSLSGCTLNGFVDFREAELSGALTADDTIFNRPGQIVFAAQQAATAGWSLRNSTFKGGVALDGASVGGNLSADRAAFENPGSWALAGGVRVAGTWAMSGATVRGRTVINGSDISGQFQGIRARFECPGDIAIEADNLRVADLCLREATVRGQLTLNGSEIAGPFDAEGARFENEGNDAVVATALTAKGLSLARAIVMGGFRMRGSAIDGAFIADGATFEHHSATAIDAERSEISQGVYLRDRTRISGLFNFTAASVSKGMFFSDVEVRGNGGLAVTLAEAHIRGSLAFRNAHILGCVACSGLHVEGRVDLSGAHIAMDTSAARDGSDPGPYSCHAIRLQEARINGRLTLPAACPTGIVDLSRASCDTLEDTATGWPPPLPQKADACESRHCIPTPAGTSRDVQHLVLDGFEYRFFAHPSGQPDGVKDIGRARTDWLAGQSVEELRERFNPQPWKQAATVLRSMGYDEDAQDLSIERRVRQRFARSTPVGRRFISWLLHKTADYGFNPWKTVCISIGVILGFAVVYFWGVRACDGYGVWSSTPGACGQAPPFAAVRYGDIRPGIAEHAYPAFNPIMYSLDIFVPVLDLGAESYWHANTAAMRPVGYGIRRVGLLLYLGVVIERFLGAILIAIAVTGFTGLLTRDEK